MGGATIVAAGLSVPFVQSLETYGFGVAKFESLKPALQFTAERSILSLVLLQPHDWSLDRIARETQPLVAGRPTIVISPRGALFAPDLYVVDGDITPGNLIRLIERVNAPLSSAAVPANSDSAPPRRASFSDAA
jgi:hypothetical protein